MVSVSVAEPAKFIRPKIDWKTRDEAAITNATTNAEKDLKAKTVSNSSSVQNFSLFRLDVSASHSPASRIDGIRSTNSRRERKTAEKNVPWIYCPHIRRTTLSLQQLFGDFVRFAFWISFLIHKIAEDIIIIDWAESLLKICLHATVVSTACFESRPSRVGFAALAPRVGGDEMANKCFEVSILWHSISHCMH